MNTPKDCAECAQYVGRRGDMGLRCHIVVLKKVVREKKKGCRLGCININIRILSSAHPENTWETMTVLKNEAEDQVGRQVLGLEGRNPTYGMVRRVACSTTR